MSQIFEVKVPELGEGIESTQISSILIEVGEQVQKGQSLLEVESDKASIEIPAPCKGTVKEIYVQNGQSIRIGQKILSLELELLATEEAHPISPIPAGTQKESQASQRERSSPSTHSPLLQEMQETNKENEPETQKIDRSIPIPAAPSVRRLARELGADIYSIIGSGIRGAISAEDVKNYVKNILTKNLAKGSSTIGRETKEIPPLPDFSQFGPIHREKMQSIRQKISQKMELSWQTIPHVTQFDEAEITALENFRKRKNRELQKKGLKLTVTSLALKCAALALRTFPKLNASLDIACQEIIYKDYVHIGIAVDTPQGLLVPVLRDADKKDLITITEELSTLAQKAREKKIQAGELQGSCLSLTNLGGLGTTHFTPIINWPEVAVLGLGRAKSQLSMNGGSLQQQLLLPLSLSYDHRIIDGAEAARFLRWIAENLEYPSNL